MSHLLPEKPTQSHIQRHSGFPKKPLRKDETTRWQRFLRFLVPWLRNRGKLADDLGEKLLRAKVRRATAEARKTEAEARKTAAEADEVAARVDERRLNYFKTALDLADERFEPNSPMGDLIKFHAIGKLDPNLAAQLKLIIAIQDDLLQHHGTQVQILADAAELSPPQRRPASH